jgi:hypothetical protein
MSSQAHSVLIVPDVRVNVDTRVPRSPRSFKGLCVNCDDRFICTYRWPESGVWNCEGYR